MMKKSISFYLLIAALTTTVFSALPVCAEENGEAAAMQETEDADLSSGNFETDGSVAWSYDKETKTLTVSGSGLIPNYEYEGAEDEENPDQTFHDTPWRAYKEEAETIVIEEGITAIGKYAFDDFAVLETVILPDSIEKIEKKTFPYREEKENITLKGKNCSPAELYAYENGYRYAPTNECLRGDINGNGNYEASDALLILRMVVKLDTQYPYSADADEDGTVNAADALFVLRKTVKII